VGQIGRIADLHASHPKGEKVEVYSSYYLTEPVSKMPYLHWERGLNFSEQTSF
jgi:hypothetical protein